MHIIIPRATAKTELRRGGRGNFLVVQWVGIRAVTAKGLGSIPGWGTKISTGNGACPPPKKKHRTMIANLRHVHVYFGEMVAKNISSPTCKPWG